MIILSIDIGEKNLGYTIAEIKSLPFKLEDAKIVSGVFDYKNKGKNVVLSRVSSLHQFFHEHIHDEVKFAIIERQVTMNKVAMELMYAVTAIIYNYTTDIVIFDPKMKFTHIGQQYDTKNKNHKKQSIKNMRVVLSHVEKPELLTVLDAAEKKDDIADSFNQFIVCCDDRKYLDIEDIRDLYRE